VVTQAVQDGQGLAQHVFRELGVGLERSQYGLHTA
jgi:hypothetical protein